MKRLIMWALIIGFMVSSRITYKDGNLEISIFSGNVLRENWAKLKRLLKAKGKYDGTWR